MNLDFLIFQFINNLAGHWAWLDALGIFLSAYWQYFLGAGVVIFLFWKNSQTGWRQSLKLTGWFFGTAAVSRLVFGEIIKRVISRQRPFEIHQVAQILPYDPGHSFPSGHMTFFFALCTAMYLYIKKAYPQYGWWAGLILFGGSFLIGLARIFVGIHYPSDILGGMIFGILVGWGSWLVFKKYFFAE